MVIAGIENSLRSDNFVGVEIIRHLRNKISKSVYPTPESRKTAEYLTDRLLEILSSDI